MHTKAGLFGQKYSKTVIVWNIIAIKNNWFVFYYTVMESCDGNAEFSAAITPVFNVTSFRNHYNLLI